MEAGNAEARPPVIRGRAPMALFSLLRPGKHIAAHTGLLNTRLANSYWLPAATITWTVIPDVQLRFHGSKTIARPQFRELAPQLYTDFETTRQFFGNPYPSPIDFSQTAGVARTNVDNAVYVFQSTGQYTGMYRTYVNGVGGDPLVASMQGFFGRVSTPGTGSLALNGATNSIATRPVDR